MQIDKKIDKVKEILLWVYIAAITIGIIYAVDAGEKTKSPAQIIYEISQTR